MRRGTRGTSPTPLELKLTLSEGASENMYEAHMQLRRQGIQLPVIREFEQAVYNNRTPKSGQVGPFALAARAIGAKVHWLG